MSELYQLMFRKRGRTNWVEDEALPRPIDDATELLYRSVAKYGLDYEFKLEPIEDALT